MHVQAGDVLTVSENSLTGVLEAISSNGEVCGSIISSINRIKNCMKKGTVFQARVIIRDMAECQVLVFTSSQ